MSTRGSIKVVLTAVTVVGFLSQPLVAAASAQETLRHPVSSVQTMNSQQLRARHPVTQGGTTGGTVNPAINGNHKQSGYNGG
jgi:hypothetical protein